MKSLDQVVSVDFIARPVDFNPPLDPRDGHEEYIAFIAITYRDGSREEVYRSSDYHPTIHAAVWDAAKVWRTTYLKNKG